MVVAGADSSSALVGAALAFARKEEEFGAVGRNARKEDRTEVAALVLILLLLFLKPLRSPLRFFAIVCRGGSWRLGLDL